MNKQFTNKGLTLIDLVITMSVGAIVMSAAVPSYNTMTMNNRRAAAVNGLVADLNLARSEAVKRGTSVSVCKSSDGQSCNTSTLARAWSQGWIIFVDINEDGTIDSGETELKVSEVSTTVYSWHWVANHSSQYITYKGSGFTDTTGRFKYCDKRGSSQGRSIALKYTGRPKLIKGASCV